MSIRKVVILLGKRLVGDRLTAEGHSRVVGLVKALPNLKQRETVLLFCGGVTAGNTCSEAEAMFQAFISMMKQSNLTFPTDQILLENRSVSTVENIQNASQELLNSGLISKGDELEVVFVSNDYHLQRIFEIQQLMDEQGLLKVLRDKTVQQGIKLAISYQIDDHIAVPYPHISLRSQLFLLMDVLTTYRVFLEGVVRGAFKRDIESVQCVPLRLAEQAIHDAKLLSEKALVSGQVFTLLDERLPQLEKVVRETKDLSSVANIESGLEEFHRHLTALNRYLDPESLSPKPL
ncbi:YdcF family protein [Vibrio paucivorans]|uniref:YdcF family protein n=1 Tax=Vibrio paucivorans TaxID=2829489 RepID=A0A9X3CEG9_9VIBR|nr:YdcF family protein [Vibrio paucivorans]MCW8334170.1 YdcF family protein [Vibrio paucivorans]